MSDRAKSTMGNLAYYAAVVTVAILIFTKAVGAGEILHEIKGLRVDLNDIKLTMKEIQEDQRKLERRVDVLETSDSRRLNNYERTK